MSFVQHKTYPLLPDGVTILNQLGYNTLDLNRLGNHTRMRGRVEGRITVLVLSIPSYLQPKKKYAVEFHVSSRMMFKM